MWLENTCQINVPHLNFPRWSSNYTNLHVFTHKRSLSVAKGACLRHLFIVYLLLILIKRIWIILSIKTNFNIGRHLYKDLKLFISCFSFDTKAIMSSLVSGKQSSTMQNYYDQWVLNIEKPYKGNQGGFQTQPKASAYPWLCDTWSKNIHRNVCF